MENKITKRIEYFLYFLLIFNPFIDLINGMFFYVLNSELLISPGQLVRGLLLFFVIHHVYKSGIKQKILLLICFLLFGFQEIIHITNDANLITDSLFISKIWLNVFLFILFVSYNRNIFLQKTKLINAFLIGANFISFTIIITTLLGLSEESYGGVGSKGFFMGLNDISAIITMAIPLALYQLIITIKKPLKILYFIMVLSLLATMFILGTKAPIVFGIFSLFLYIIYMVKSQINKKILIIIIGSFCLLIPFLYNNIQHIFARQLYYFEKLDFLSFILSGRNKIAEVAADYFIQKWWFVFLGTGFTSGSNWIKNNFDPKHGMIEMDFLDIFYFYGLLFLGIVILCVIPIVFLAFRNLFRNVEFLNKTIFLAIIIGFLLSFLGGHVLLSPLSGPYFIFLLVLGMTLIKNSKNGNKKTIYMVGPDINLKGGISSVIKQYYHSELNEKYNVMLISSTGNRRLLTFLKAILKYPYLQVFGKVDLVHIHVASNGSFLRKAIFCFLTSKQTPYIFHVHGGGFLNFYEKSPILLKKIIAYSISNSQQIIVLSNDWKEQFIKTFNLPETKVEKMENGIHILNEPKLNLKNQHQVLYLGKLTRTKGIYDLLDAVPFIVKKHPEVKFIIAGDGDIEKVRFLVKEKKIDKNVEVTGWIDGAVKEKHLQKSSILVVPSHFEAFGISIIEAMSFGCAIVASNVGGIPEIVKEGKNGYLFKKEDITDLKHKLDLLLMDRNRIQSMGNKNLNEVNKYLITNVINKLDLLYRLILKR
jgi:glycosyltransferase involved in cell wall biosynthesis